MNSYLDLSEFLTNPQTAGIARVIRELCRFADPGTLIPVRLAPEGLVAFSPQLLDGINNYFQIGKDAASDLYQLSNYAVGRRIIFTRKDRLLVPEAFLDRDRLTFYRQLHKTAFDRVHFIVHDLLPLTRPEFFSGTSAVYEYFSLVCRATHCAFVSEDTRHDYYFRLRRTTKVDGPVLPLGADALGAKPLSPHLNRPPLFSVIGAIEPRKNHQLILEAFQPLLSRFPEMRLAFVGQMGWVPSAFAHKVWGLAADKNSRLEFVAAPGDEVVRRYIENSRATLYLSSAEGYGLPPLESLWLGTPVIASRFVPSLKSLGSTGIEIVDPLNVETARTAVLSFMNQEYANRKALETASLDLPVWRDFATETLRWFLHS